MHVAAPIINTSEAQCPIISQHISQISIHPSKLDLTLHTSHHYAIPFVIYIFTCTHLPTQLTFHGQVMSLLDDWIYSLTGKHLHS